jgi:response regulator RpfG family c-di-GMP phosphodiesterase
MKHETEFGSYLREVKRSAKTQQPFSPKVASDTVSRCKMVERALEIELSARTVGTDAGVQKVIEAIKAARLGATETRQYAYNEHILAVRTYREFLAWREPV